MAYFNKKSLDINFVLYYITDPKQNLISVHFAILFSISCFLKNLIEIELV